MSKDELNAEIAKHKAAVSSLESALATYGKDDRRVKSLSVRYFDAYLGDALVITLEDGTERYVHTGTSVYDALA